MPKLKTPDTQARHILFRASDSALARMTGACRQTMAKRKEKPGTLTLDELAALVEGQDITDEELVYVVRNRGKLIL